MNKGLRKNREINSPEVRLVGQDEQQDGIVPFAVALRVAQDAGLDLVEVSPARENQPPVCRLMNYGKYIYQQHKNLDVAKKNQRKVHLKEVRFTPRIGPGDFDVKLKMIVNFLSEGDKVKATVRFRGREMSYKEQGMEILKKIEEQTNSISIIEQTAKFEGRQMTMVLAPAKKAAS